MIHLRKNISDSEAAAYLEEIVKALDKESYIPMAEVTKKSPNPADKHMMLGADKAFKKMMDGIVDDIVNIIKE